MKKLLSGVFLMLLLYFGEIIILWVFSIMFGGSVYDLSREDYICLGITSGFIASLLTDVDASE